jgi:exonuclease III
MLRISDSLQIASWNVRGLGNPHRNLTVQDWRRRLHPGLDIFALQELQANAATVEFQLCTIIPDGDIVIDCTPEGRVGSALLVKQGIQVVVKGQKGDGTFT